MRKLPMLIAVNCGALVLLVALGTAAPTEDTTPTPKKCQDVCTLDNIVVCGYDGNCYKEYPNKCAYDLEKCSKRNSLETVDISLCELAAKDNHPNFKICAE